MAHKIDYTHFNGYLRTDILCRSVDKPLKYLVMNTFTIGGKNNQIQMITSFCVKDQLGKIRWEGDHLHLAVIAYNKLYNEGSV